MDIKKLPFPITAVLCLPAPKGTEVAKKLQHLQHLAEKIHYTTYHSFMQPSHQAEETVHLSLSWLVPLQLLSRSTQPLRAWSLKWRQSREKCGWFSRRRRSSSGTWSEKWETFTEINVFTNFNVFYHRLGKIFLSFSVNITSSSFCCLCTLWSHANEVCVRKNF